MLPLPRLSTPTNWRLMALRMGIGGGKAGAKMRRALFRGHRALTLFDGRGLPVLRPPLSARRPGGPALAARPPLSTCVKHSLESPPKPDVPRAGWMEKGSACTHHLRLSGDRSAPRPRRRAQSDAWIVHAWTTLPEISKLSFQRRGRLGAINHAAKKNDWDISASIIIIIVCLGRCWCAHKTNGKHRSDQ